MSPPTGSSSSTTQWHSVSPLTRPLSISILELAPTSVTLALTRSPPSAPGPSSATSLHHLTQHLAHSHHAHAHPHLHGSHGHAAGGASSGGASSSSNGVTHSNSKKKKKKRHSNAHTHHAGDSDDAADDGDDDGNAIPGAYPYSSMLSDGQTFKDMLSHGVVVTLDGMPWSRIVAHVSDDEDEDGGVPGTSDDEGDWEDEWDHHGDGTEEGLANSSCTEHGQLPRRRRRQRPLGADQTRPAGSPRTKPTEKPDRGPRWDRERAVVVVYDLDPSKEHEIELQIVGLAGEIKESIPVSNTILISPLPTTGSSLHPRSRANSLRSRSRPRSRSNSINTAPVHPVPSPLGTEIPSSPGRSSTPLPDERVVPTSILSPIDAQTAQTRHLIAAAHAEREHLQLQIKEARKTAQRSEASLRTEIESMKKSNEKAGSSDQRNKQKYLALQEQVKQGWAGSETANTETGEVKAAMPALEARLAAVNTDLEAVHADWMAVKETEEDAREADRKNRADEDRKLAEVNSKIDKARARKDKKEAERTELLKRLEDLEHQREEIERKADEEKTMRRAGYYPGLRWEQAQAQAQASGVGGPGGAAVPGEFGAGGGAFAERGGSLSARPSMNNIGTAGGFGSTGTGFRPRGGFTHRYPSGGRQQAPPAQPSPTLNQTFFPPNAPTSPVWNTTMSKPNATNTRGSGGGSGTNPAAAPFLPSGFSNTAGGGPASNASGTFDPALHTAFMPPQLQHRIYLPNSVRPRPTPNFHPPPSVLAEQQAQAASSSGSSSNSSLVSPTGGSGSVKPSPLSPAFPPLPTHSPPTSRASTASNSAGGPSLASIVTRAVLAPTSNALVVGAGPGPIGTGGGRSPTSPQNHSQHGHNNGGGKEFPPLSPTAVPFQSPAHTTPTRVTPPPGMHAAGWGAVGSAVDGGA